MRDIFGDYVEETDEEYLFRLEREAELADEAYAEMLAHCSGCEHFKHGSRWRDIDEFPDCIKDNLTKKRVVKTLSFSRFSRKSAL